MITTGYDLSRHWFDFCFENPDKISPNHSAIFFFAIEHCNRLGWKEKFGFPTQMTMDAIGIKKHQTYIKYFNDLCEWGFFNLVQKSVNQYSANIISLSFGITKNGKALDKAFITHAAKQTQSNGQSNGQSNSSINKQLTINKEQVTKEPGNFSLWTEIKNNFFQAEDWQYNFCIEKKIDRQILIKKMREFIVDLDLKEEYKDLRELKSHFTNLFNKNKKLAPAHESGNGGGLKLKKLNPDGTLQQAN